MSLTKISVVAITFVAGTMALSALAQAPSTPDASEVKIITPNEIKYSPLPFAPGAEVVYLASDGKKSENYVIRVHLATGAKIPPHTHPDTRMLTVLSGDLFIGTGAKFDSENTTLVTAGTFFVMPSGVIHWAWAKTGEVTYQESGTGPSAFTLVK